MSGYFFVYCLNCDAIFSSIHLIDLKTCPVCKEEDTIYPVVAPYFHLYINTKTQEPIIQEV